jgi:polar amino acid transport system substrate-binding protein
MPWALFCFFATLLLAFGSCGEFPKDLSGATDRIRERGEIRVGLIESPPYVIRTEGEPQGVEVDAIRRFAESQNVRPVWQWGGEERLMTELEYSNLEIVAGGLTDKNPWKKSVGITAPYSARHVFAVPPGDNQLVKRLDEFMSAIRPEVETAIIEGEMAK